MKHNDILNNLDDHLVPPVIKEAAEKHGMTVPELLEKAAASYDDFIDRGLDLTIEYNEEGMNKKAEMEKLSYMDKQALIGLSTLAAAAAIPFAALSAYDLGKNVLGGAGDMVRGDFGKAFKRAPSMAFDTLGVLPGVGVAGKGAKWLKALKGSKSLGKGLKGMYHAEQAITHGKKLAGARKAIDTLKTKGLWYNPFTWSEAGRLKKLKKLEDFVGPEYKARLKAAQKAMVEGFGKGADKFAGRAKGWVEGDLGWGRALGLSKKVPKAKDIEKIKAFELLHSPKWHKFYQHADPLDAISMIRMAPVVPLLGGAAIGSEGLQRAGAKGMDFLNYYGDDPDALQAARLAQARTAMRGAGYMAGYGGG